MKSYWLDTILGEIAGKQVCALTCRWITICEPQHAVLHMKRRALLTTALGSSLITSGCLDGGGSKGEGTTVEIIPSNYTNQQISLDVAVYATDGSLLLDHSYSLPAEHSDESQGVEDRVDYLVVSLNGGNQTRHEYNPDVDICSREGEDVQIMVKPEGVTFEYSC